MSASNSPIKIKKGIIPKKTSSSKSTNNNSSNSIQSQNELNENQQKIIGRIIYDRKREGLTLIDQYFELQIEFEKKYGPQTVVMMQVGDFFEFYGVDNEKEKIGDMVRVAEIMNIQLSRRNKSILENSRENAQFCGFPIEKVSRFLNVLLQNNYTVILIEQTADCQGTTREIKAVYSPGTYIDEVTNADPNYIMSIYIEEETSYKTGMASYFVGMSSIDLSTGSCTVYQKTNHIYDKVAVFEDMYRFMESYNPKEIVLYHGDLRTISVEEVMNHLDTNNRIFHRPIEMNQSWEGKMPVKYSQLYYQNEFLGRVYPDHGFYTPIEYLNLERSQQALMSFLMLLEFAYEHNEMILRKIKRPETWEYPQHLILYHNTMYQLNIISNNNNNNNSGGRYKSLFDVIQKTSTAMGRRLLKHRLMNPITSKEELESRYQKISVMLEGNRLTEVSRMLMEILDIERMHRRMELGMIHPHEFGALDNTYEKVRKMIEWMKNEDGNILEDYGLIDEVIGRFDEYRELYKSRFDMLEIQKHNLQGISDNFFLPGVVPELDDIQEKIKGIYEYFEMTTNHLSNLIEGGSDFVKWDMNNRDGYFMVCTKKRSEILEKKLGTEEKKKYEIKKLQSTTVKITTPEWETKSYQLIALKEKIKSVAREKYLETIQVLVGQYDDILKEITSFVAHVDVVKSSTLCSRIFGYNRPNIVDRYEGKSYFKSEKMRHPLIEVLHDDVVYVDNDVELLKGLEDCNGILLMGLNGVGKSSMAKAIGCNIVLAQIGMYVACKDFEYYPYEKIFTRINGDDNIFKGMSSFVVEMNELRSILKYADGRSLVLGDEVCKGTEETSALSIVSATIQRFSEKGVNFVMATHFHKLHEMTEIQELKNVRFKHLSVSYDESGDKIIYGRKLLDGPGDTLYGLEIARFLIKDDEFFRKARITRNKILGQSDQILENKKSNYNAELLVSECLICGKTNLQTELHTHHLMEQNEFSEETGNNINGVRKNQLGNLVVLCEEHHEEVHHGNLEIRGWKDTTMGRVLDWGRIMREEQKIEVEVEEEEDKEDDWLEEEIRKLRRSGLNKKVIVNTIYEKLKVENKKMTKKEIESKMLVI